MPNKKTPYPTLFIRSGYFVDSLRLQSRLSVARLERRIRENIYEKNGVHAPSEDTVRDYCSLRRSVAFEPRVEEKKDKRIAPWLLAAELEFPNSSFAFFHPLFDLLFGTLESAYFWQAHFCMIPESWIEDLRRRGASPLADEWEEMNVSLKERRHRTRTKTELDRLSFVHLSMMRLPRHISGRLFEKEEHSSTRFRRWFAIEEDIVYLQSQNNLNAIAALLALLEEGAAIGDAHRYRCAYSCLVDRLPLLKSIPGCKRMGIALELAITSHLEGQAILRSYNGTLYSGFGMPVSWRSMLQENLLEKCQEDDFSEFSLDPYDT